MGTKVNSGTAGASVSTVKPRVGLQVIRPHASVSYVVPAAEVEYILLQTSAYLDSSGRYQYKGDSVVILESRIIEIAKQINEGVYVDELAAKEVVKAYIESVAIDDVFFKTVDFGRLVDDTLALADAVSKEMATQVDEVVNTNDVNTLSTAKGLSDAVSLNDTADLEYDLQKYINNVVLPDDLAFKSVGKLFADSISLSETIEIIKTLAVPLYDSFTLTDDSVLVMELLKADTATILDSLAIDNAKTVTDDSISSTDTVSLNLGQAISDTATILSAGSLLSQDYCDFSYFAADYVGQTRTFT